MRVIYPTCWKTDLRLQPYRLSRLSRFEGSAEVTKCRCTTSLIRLHIPLRTLKFREVLLTIAASFVLGLGTLLLQGQFPD
jgi:hypothetical protein